MSGVKISVSLPAGDVEFLDHYVRHAGARSRSAAVHHAINVLRSAQLADAYAQAWEEWTHRGEQEAWEATTSDGLAPDSQR